MSDLESVANEADLGLSVSASAADYELLCVSHQAWDSVYRRVQHLLSRCAQQRRVVFVEAAAPTAGPPRIELDRREGGLVVATPYVPRGLTGDEGTSILRGLLDGLVRNHLLRRFLLWHDSPRMLAACRHLRPLATVYDRAHVSWEGADGAAEADADAELLRAADLVFVDGPGEYLVRGAAAAVHLFPGGVDAAHFARARGPICEPVDQAEIPRPRLGFHGALDHNVDLDLLAAVADLRADFHLVLSTPDVTVDPDRLPRRANIHYLGRKSYAQLPDYLAGWDVALLPYVRGVATCGMNPPQTLEYLAAGRPVVATPIRDIINPYAVQGLVAIADSPGDFVVAVDCELRRHDRRRWLQRVDAFVHGSSWDVTWREMEALLAPLACPRRFAGA